MASGALKARSLQIGTADQTEAARGNDFAVELERDARRAFAVQECGQALSLFKQAKAEVERAVALDSDVRCTTTT